MNRLKTYRQGWLCLALGIVIALALPPVTWLAQAAAGWCEPTILWQELWDNPLYADLDDSGSRIVALIPYSGSCDTCRLLQVSEKNGNAWSQPLTIANNGAYSDAPFQVLPQVSHPVISGDGETIAYVGYTGTTYGVYISDRMDGVWSAPTLLNTGLENHHYQISISQDGNTIAYTDYSFWGTSQLYLSTRSSETWSPKVRISNLSGPHIGGGSPSLSADGRSVVYISNTQVMYSHKENTIWSVPQALTNHDQNQYNAEWPQISADGAAVYYWLVTLVPQDELLVRTSQSLYLQRWNGDAWSAPQKVTADPVLPSSVTDGPAAADAHATRIIYTRPFTVTDPGDQHVYIDSSRLELSEWGRQGWQSEVLVERGGYGNYNKWPLLTPDGLLLVFDTGIRYIQPLPVYDALWQISTTIAPPPLEFPTEYVYLPILHR